MKEKTSHEIENRKEEFKSNFGLFQYLKWRTNKKELEKERELLEIRAEIEAKMEIANLLATEVTQEKIFQIKKKWRKRYNLE